MSNADDAMTRYARGDEGAFDIVYETVAPRLEAYLRRRVRDAERMEDIIQQTFLQMHTARGTFIAGAAVLPWAFAIASRLLIDSLRRKPREQYVDMDDHAALPGLAMATLVFNGEESLTAKETEQRIVDAFRRLTACQRAAYELVTTEGLSHG